MTLPAQATKAWFIHVGGQPQGPLALEQVADKYREGLISRDTHVWCEGMPAWQTAKDVPEISAVLRGSSSYSGPVEAAPPAAPRSAQELSHLIELNPREVDDRTSAIEPGKLKEAKKAAAKALKVADKAERQAMAITNSVVGSGSGGGRKGVLAVIVGVPLLAAASLGGAVALKWVTVDQLKARAGHLLGGLMSTLPQLDDVPADQYEALRAAAGADVAQGATAAIALSRQSLDKPVFYVASNLPEGASLSFQLQADPRNVLADRPIQVRFPLAISKHLFRSSALHTADGTPFPQGEYVATVVGDEENPADVKAALARSRLQVSQKFFLGGQKDAAYAAKLEQLHVKQREQALVEYKQAALLAFRLDAQLSLDAGSFQQMSKAKRPQLTKLWADFDRRWAQAAPEPLEKGVFLPDLFAAIHGVWADGKKVHDLAGSAAAGTADPSAVWPQVTAGLTQVTQRLAAVKAQIDSAGKSVGAASATH